MADGPTLWPKSTGRQQLPCLKMEMEPVRSGIQMFALLLILLFLDPRY